MIWIGFMSVLQPLPDTSTSANLLSALFVKSTVVARTVELVQDVISRVAEVLSESLQGLERRL